MKNKISSYRGNNIEALSERLRSLKITNKVSGSINKWTDTEMLISLVAMQENNEQTIVSKSMVLDLGYFDGNRMKFKDW